MGEHDGPVVHRLHDHRFDQQRRHTEHHAGVPTRSTGRDSGCRSLFRPGRRDRDARDDRRRREGKGGEVRATRRLLWLERSAGTSPRWPRGSNPTHSLVWMPVVCPRLHRQCEQHGENDQRLHQQDRTPDRGPLPVQRPPTAMTAPIHHLALMAPESADSRWRMTVPQRDEKAATMARDRRKPGMHAFDYRRRCSPSPNRRRMTLATVGDRSASRCEHVAGQRGLNGDHSVGVKEAATAPPNEPARLPVAVAGRRRACIARRTPIVRSERDSPGPGDPPRRSRDGTRPGRWCRPSCVRWYRHCRSVERRRWCAAHCQW